MIRVIGPEYAYLILDTKEQMTNLRFKISKMKEFVSDEREMMEFIFQAIAYEHNAELELAYDCLDIVKECLGEAYEQDVAIIAKAYLDFGTQVFKELQRIRAYRRGYLFYNYAKTIGSDVVLARLDLPEIPKT